MSLMFIMKMNNFLVKCVLISSFVVFGSALNSNVGKTCTVGDLARDPEDCTKYYMCDGIGWVSKSCATGLFFNPKTNQCDFRGNVPQCLENKIPLGKTCTVGDLKPDPEDCSQYYMCNGLDWVAMPCPAGLVFSPVTSQCALPSDVPECNENEIHKVNLACTLDDLKPDSENCSQYYICTGNDWQVMACYPGLVFNPKISQCDYASNVPECNTDSQNKKQNVELACTLDDLKPDSENCSQYYVCTGNDWQVLPCYPGLVFNPVTSQCDYPSNVPECNADSQNKKEIADTTCTLDDLKPDPEDCTQYYVCTGNAWQVLPCYPGLVFNPETSQCDYPSNVPECNADSKNVLPVPTENSDCGDLPLSQLKPDPNDCGRFLQCTPSGLVSLPCPSGLYFNPSTHLCDYPSNVNC